VARTLSAMYVSSQRSDSITSTTPTQGQPCGKNSGRAETVARMPPSSSAIPTEGPTHSCRFAEVDEIAESGEVVGISGVDREAIGVRGPGSCR